MIQNDIERILRKEQDIQSAAKKISELFLPENYKKNIKMHEKATSILARIRLHTSKNKIKSAELEREFSIGGQVLREQVIHPLRIQGELICSDDSGYWYGTPEEAENCAMALKGRAYKVLVASDGMLSTVSRIEQISMF